jgi:hypothetical protein
MRRRNIGEQCDHCPGILRPVPSGKICESSVERGNFIGWKTTLLLRHLACEKCGLLYEAVDANKPIGIIIETHARDFKGSPENLPSTCPDCEGIRVKTARYYIGESASSTKTVPANLNARNLAPFQTYAFCPECLRICWVSPPVDIPRTTLAPPGMSRRS